MTQTIPDGTTPYAHWFQTIEKGLFDGTLEAQKFLGSAAFIQRAPSRQIQAAYAEVPHAQVDQVQELFGQILDEYFSENAVISLPKDAINDLAFQNLRNIDASGAAPQALILPGDQVAALAAAVSDQAVLTGIIDTGVAIGNERFRASPDQSRVLSSWQQGGAYKGQAILPFGREIYLGDIERGLARYGGDEEAFNRALELSEPLRQNGQRDLDFNLAHGTHVADLAAGEEPASGPVHERDRPILVVNLPPRINHGSAGHFLEFFAVWAMMRIVLTSYQISLKKFDGEANFTALPLVINLSFGMQAGPKDGSMTFERVLSILKAFYPGELRIVMPAGNDNLARASARSCVPTNVIPSNDGPQTQTQPVPLELGWRVLPSDTTSNFVEIWTSETSEDGPDLSVNLTNPNGIVFGPFASQTAHFSELKENGNVFGHVYAITQHRGPIADGSGILTRYRFVIALMPSWIVGSTPADTCPAPAGLWKIEVNKSGTPLDVFLHVQSDQSLRPGQTQMRNRSYFESPAYSAYTDPSDGKGPLANVPIGMPRQSHYRSSISGNIEHLDDWLYEGPIQRKGSHNALATADPAIMIGAYRISDSAMSFYSSASHANSPCGNQIAQNPVATPIVKSAFPGDDTPSHPGLLGSGSKSGSRVLLQGTSTSAPLAARTIADAFFGHGRKGPLIHNVGTEAWLGLIAGAAALPVPDPLHGGGRLVPSSHYAAISARRLGLP